MIDWFILQEIGFYIFLFFTVFYTCKRRYVNLLALYFWGTAFACCYKYAITLWTPEKMVSLAMIWCILFHKSKNRSKSLTILIRIFVAIIALVLFGDLIAFFTPPKFQVAISPIQRIVLQNVSYVTSASVLLFGVFLPHGFIKEFYPKYCRAVECGILVGSAQYLCVQFSIPFMPILRTGGVVNEMNSVLGMFGGEVMIRIYGFAGEPKGLGFLIVPYLVISIVNFIKGHFRVGLFYHLAFMALGGFILFTTLSSSAFINFFLMIPIILLLTNVNFVVGGKLQGISIFLIVMFFAGISLLGKEAIAPSDHTFWDDINDRTFRRGQTELSEGRQESVIFSYYSQEDVITNICGWGIGQYTFHVPDQVTEEGQLIPVQSGILLTLTDFGLLGILLYIYIIAVCVRLVIKCRSIYSPLPLAFAMAAISKCIESFMHGSIITCLMFLMIAYYAYEDSIKKVSLVNI